MPDSFFTSSKPRKRKRTNDAGPSSSKKVPRKGAQQNGVRFQGPKSNGAQKKRKTADEELDSDHPDDDAGDIDDIDLRAPSDDDEVSGEEDPDETPAEKRLRLAQLYIDGVKEGLKLADGEFDAAEIDRELITARLKQDVLEHSGKIHLFIADSFDFSEPPKTIFRTKTSKSSVTCAVAAESGQYLFTSEKDGTITKWDLTSRKKAAIFHSIRTQAKGKGKAQASGEEVKGHTDEVLALALSDDGKYLASGGKDRRLGVWDAENAQWIRGFIEPMCHKDTISALSFRKGTHQLYSGSLDRSLKVFDLSPGVMGYVETLFGHQDHVVALDSLRGETCVSVGARDKTARYWKIVEETQLVFRGGGRSRVRDVLEGGLADQEDGEPEPKRDVTMKFVEGRLECVAMIDESMFVSGGDSGSICLWMTQKKKPVFTQPLSHGFNEVSSETEGIIKTPRWVTALASLRYSDLFASGSWEGDIRLWKLDSKLKSFSLVGTIPALGVVNSLQFVSPPKSFFDGAEWTKEGQLGTDGASKRRDAGRYLLIAGMGREHKFGRWQNVKEGWNRALVVALSPRTSS
ncbi:WD40-repeat-containing domain protein [Desarmillaria tabescens]|uniref:WD40-repeat-containing domain protein n=1 Tax=Armillaria tabescens TaxID=1929756 RepID=A0AA39U8A2_ARMTA|nr:WD40-repeat-containing domain protein [Desarmillaria tabescens]KAK0469290.1 WD40-repeat-containing domain protein [Desarmillaria tabescens]